MSSDYRGGAPDKGRKVTPPPVTPSGSGVTHHASGAQAPTYRHESAPAPFGGISIASEGRTYGTPLAGQAAGGHHQQDTSNPKGKRISNGGVEGVPFTPGTGRLLSSKGQP